MSELRKQVRNELSTSQVDWHDNNPYKNFTPVGWNKAKQAQDALVKGQQYEAELAEKIRQETYNDPAAQVIRMRLAGYNPDLQGGISPGEASQASGLPSAETPQGAGDMAAPVLIDVGTTLLGLATSLVNLPAGISASVSGLAGLSKNLFDNKMGMMNSVMDAISSGSLSGKDPVAQAQYMAKFLHPNSRKKQSAWIEQYGDIFNSIGARLAGVQNETDFNKAISDIAYSDFAMYQEIVGITAANQYQEQQLKSLVLQAQTEFQAKNAGKINAAQESDLDRQLAENKVATDTANATNGAAVGTSLTKQAEAATAEAELRKTIAENTDGVAVGQAATAEAEARTATAKLNKLLAELTDPETAASAINSGNFAQIQEMGLAAIQARSLKQGMEVLGSHESRKEYRKKYGRGALREVRQRNRFAERRSGIQTRGDKTFDKIERGFRTGGTIGAAFFGAKKASKGK